MDVKKFRNLGVHNGRQYYGVGPDRGPWIKLTNIENSSELPYEMTMEQFKSLPQFDMSKELFPAKKGVVYAVKPNEHYKAPIATCGFHTTKDSDVACITYPVKIVEG